MVEQGPVVLAAGMGWDIFYSYPLVYPVLFFFPLPLSGRQHAMTEILLTGLLNLIQTSQMMFLSFCTSKGIVFLGEFIHLGPVVQS